MSIKNHKPKLGVADLVRLYATALEKEYSAGSLVQENWKEGGSLPEKESVVLEALKKDWKVTEHDFHLFLSLLSPGDKARAAALEKLHQMIMRP